MTNLASDWQFDRIVPDQDDLEAKAKAGERYHRSLVEGGWVGGYTSIDYFHAGFMRGMAWAMYKRQKQIEAIIKLVEDSGEPVNVIWELLKQLPAHEEFYTKWIDKR